MNIFKSMLPITLINFIALFFMTVRLPSKIPIHVNYLMAVDRFGSKWIVLVTGILPVLVSVALLFYFHRSKTSFTVLRSKKAESILFPIIATFLMILSWLPVFLALNVDGTKSSMITIPIDLMILFPLGVFVIVFSNFMSVIKYSSNYVGLLIGFRTPWTIKNETVWKKTHRFGGYVGVISGIVMCVSSFVGFVLKTNTISIIGLTIGVLLFTVIPTIYSYVVYKKEASK